ncbi:hypothetical protein TL16_g10769 [Triparma laevis f. inornata]|uniref:Biotin-protein ligase N-terminal domain-containing protein n=2 Tax=Triparma laevis TaxID=1534972 RepID=A0A9W7CGL2_9STRA|nr:hypothetical protein TL16_g10769 [Triparma laevis f. inornata]GMI05721.1 hypothetical protein TrLO_g10624 [Triparma laevis f. longispina]
MLLLPLLLLLLLNLATATTTRVSLYLGSGTSDNDNDAFLANLPIALSQAFPHGDYTITTFLEDEFSNDLLTKTDLLIFPGGSGNGQATALGDDNLALILSWVNAGGSYIGTCGGSFLGMSHIGFYGTPTPTLQEPWDRGSGNVSVEVLDVGFEELALDRDIFAGNITIMYYQGPIVKPQDLPSDVNMLAMFRTEIATNHPEETMGEMINTPAITSKEVGKGRVVLNSPHPELQPVVPEIYAGEILWVLKLV